MDDRLLTSPAAALISLVINAEAEVPVVAIDADGLNQPLRGPLRAGNGGDLVGLSDHPKESLDRSEIELFVDQEGAMPLLACWKKGPGLITPEALESAVRRVLHLPTGNNLLRRGHGQPCVPHCRQAPRRA